jgi:hypothetical protein
MKRTAPPLFATWLLEHCTLGDSNEALAGDLLEGYSAGLSDGWYCRQVFAACAVSWSEALRVRASMLIFATIWSMMAPAWKVFIDGIEGATIFSTVLQPLGGFWLLPAFAGWLVLNGTFLWAGMLVYIFALSICGKVFRRNEVKRAFLLAPLVYAPLCGLFIFLSCLDWSFAFADQTLATSPLGQIADLRMVADLLRFPFILAMAGVLWNVLPQTKHRFQLLPVEAAPIESSAEVDVPGLASMADSCTIKRFFFFMVGAGLINAMLAGILLCRLPELHLLSFSAIFPWAVLYVVVGVLAGVAGSWLYWKSPSSLFREHPPIPFPLFALVCASGWIWIPSMVIFAEQSSPLAAIVAVLGTTFLAVGIRNATYSVFASFAPDSKVDALQESELFAESLYRAPWEAHGYVITLLLYAGVCALAIHLNYAAAALFALSVFLFIWKQTIVPNQSLAGNHEYRRAAVRLAGVSILAILVTAWAVLDGVAHRNRVEQVNAAASMSNAASTNQNAAHTTKGKSSPSGLGGYESLILWPIPEKRQIVAPTPEISLLAPGTTQPLIIPFHGVYWYLQPPNKTPGPTAHQSHGTPISLDIASINATPLVMDAHQYLATSIPVARCREIHVEIENRDNTIGSIALAVLLTDSASSKKTTLYLGQQTIASTNPENFSYKLESVLDTLRFPIPAGAQLRRFDEITVMMLPDVEHALVGPKIAIKQFQLLPR